MATDRRQWVMVPAIVGGVLGGLMFLNHDQPPLICTLLVVAGAVLSGVLDGTNLRNRLTAVVSWSLGAFIAIPTLFEYVSLTGRTSLTRFELLIPVAAGAIPILIMRAIAERGWLEKVPFPALALAAAALIVSPVAIAARMGEPEQSAVASNQLEIALIDDQLVYEGRALSDDELKNLLAGWAAQHRHGDVRLIVAKGASPNAGLARLLQPAAQHGLLVSSVEASE